MILMKRAFSWALKTGSGGRTFFEGSDIQKYATACKTDIYRVVSCQGEFTACLWRHSSSLPLGNG